MRWPHLTCLWPVLSISLFLIWHLRPPFSSIWTEFGPAVLSGLVSVADKAKRVSFEIWTDLDPTFDLAQKILRLHYNSLIESFRSPPRALPIILEIRQGEGRYKPPPPPQPTKVGYSQRKLAGDPWRHAGRYARVVFEKISLSIDRNGDLHNSTSITIINNDKFEKRHRR